MLLPFMSVTPVNEYLRLFLCPFILYHSNINPMLKACFAGLTFLRNRNYNTPSFMIKIHLFSGFENRRLKIKRDTPLGHLYSDCSREELMEAASMVGVHARCIQNSRGFYHFDLWGKPLIKARLLFPHVTNRELYRDLLTLRVSVSCSYVSLS